MALFQQGSFIFDANTSSPQELARKRAIVAQLMGQRSAPRNVGEGLVAIGDGIVANVLNRRANEAEQAGQASASAAFNPLLDAFRSRTGLDANGFPAAPNPGDSTSMATMTAPDTASARVAQAHGDSGGGFNGDLRSGIIATAEAIGADPLDLATAISYETAGTFDPTKRGPRTQWGQHRGLIQFGEPQARQHGVDWNDPLGSQLGPNGAIASYFRSSGFKPGMSGLDLYSTINAGAPGRYRASDANNGGAPGSVRDKWENQMAAHRRKAQALLGTLTATPAAPAPSNGLTPDALQQWAFANYAPQPANSAVDAVNALGAAQPVGVAENEADILAQEAAMAGQDPQAFQQPMQPAPPMPPAQMVDDMPVAGVPQQPIQTAQAGGFPEMAGRNPQALPAPGIDMQMIANVLTNPFSNPEQRAFAQMLLEQQMQANDPMRALQLEKGRLEIEALRNPTPKDTDDIREYNYAREQGYQGSFTDFMTDMRRAGATNVNVGGDGAPGLGKLSPDYGYVLDPETRQPVIDPATGLPRSAPIPGSPAAIAAEQAAAEQERLAGAQTRSDADKAETTLDATGSVLDIMRDAETPATGTLSRPFALYSGTPAGKVRSYVKTLQSGVALGAMQRLKEMSATGATGFGALSAPELDLLINDIGALDPDNTEPEIFIKTVERIRDRSRRVAQDIAKNVSPERIQELGLQPFIDAFKASEAKGNRTRSGVQWSIE